MTRRGFRFPRGVKPNLNLTKTDPIYSTISAREVLDFQDDRSRNFGVRIFLGYRKFKVFLYIWKNMLYIMLYIYLLTSKRSFYRSPYKICTREIEVHKKCTQ